MKRADFVLSIIMVPVDFLLLMLASITAYYIRFSESISEIRPVFYTMPFSEYLSLSAQMALLGIIIFAFIGFYTMKSKKLIKEIPRIITGVSTLVIFIVLFIFFQRELFSSRFIIVSAWLLAIVYIILSRFILFYFRNLFFHQGWGLSNVIVLGPAEDRLPIVNEYRQQTKFGYRIVGEFANLADLENSQPMQKLIDGKKIDQIIQTDSGIGKDQALDLLTWCQENHLSLNYVANLFQAQSLNFSLSSVAGLPLVEIQGVKLDGWGKVSKRTFDILLSLILLIILSPLFIVLAVLTKITSVGPMVVSLQRVGAKGQIFQMYKFRSMVNGAHKMKQQIMGQNERPDGPLFKMKNDPRVTGFGRWLRRTSLDELPQLWNVLKGEMSLVGPRPHEPEEVSHYQRGYKKLLSIRPGMTGMAQVSGRSNLLFSDEAKLDIFYIENWSLLLDLVIILKTPLAVIRNKESY